jgi:trk system potassium uptake protein TrkA
LSRSYGVSHIVVRLRERDFLEAYRLAGASHIISTIEMAITTMANAIEYPEVESMMHFEQGQVEVLKLPVPGDCYVAGRTVAHIAQEPRFPTGSLNYWLPMSFLCQPGDSKRQYCLRSGFNYLGRHSA